MYMSEQRRRAAPGLLLAGLAAGLLLAGCAQAARNGATLTLATWNAEWLIRPATFDELARICIAPGGRAGGEQRTIPCNLVPGGRWSDADLKRLADFARTIPADVVALQEVDGAATAARVFPGRSFCFTSRKHVQNVGFAIREGIPHRCNPDYRELGLEDNDVRWGADVTLFPGTKREIRLLAVHLKSSCNRDPLTRDSDACRTLQRQVPVLEAWIDARAAAGTPFAVLGDFNRRFDREFAPGRNHAGQIVAMWPELDDGDPAESDLVNPDTGPPAEPCRVQDPVRPAIDHILLSAGLGRTAVPDSYRMWTYPRSQPAVRWPDHCVRSVTVDLGMLGR
jgi:endonuclease/exonuclease/phosphatase family metal-dependent hydrolase